LRGGPSDGHSLNAIRAPVVKPPTKGGVACPCKETEEGAQGDRGHARARQRERELLLLLLLLLLRWARVCVRACVRAGVCASRRGRVGEPRALTLRPRRATHALDTGDRE